MPEILLKNLEVYAAADPASGKHGRSASKRRARQACVVAARDWLDRWFELDSWAGRETASDFKKRIINTYSKWRPRLLGIEANGMQVLFGALVRDEIREEFGTSPRIIPFYQPTNVEKTYRIRTGLEPIIAQGRLFLRSKTSELAVEIRGFPTAQTKDLVDMLETVIRMAPRRPEGERRSREVEEYARYLRSTNCPPRLIAEKLENFERDRET